MPAKSSRGNAYLIKRKRMDGFSNIRDKKGIR
jgi:hypothetical protein